MSEMWGLGWLEGRGQGPPGGGVIRDASGEGSQALPGRVFLSTQLLFFCSYKIGSCFSFCSYF